MKLTGIALFLLLITFSFSHFVLEPAYLYYEFKWLDIVMHLIGGFEAGLLGLGLAELFHKKKTLVWVLVFSLLIAVVWEISEYLRGSVTYTNAYDFFDSPKDIIMGLFGAWVTFRFFK